MTADVHTGLARLRQISATDRRILFVSSATVASRLLAKLAQLAFLVAAARLLSVAEFASYSYLLVLAVTFSLVADTGVALAASREISSERRPPAEAFWASAPVVGMGAAAGALAVLAFGLLDSAPGSSGVALVLACLFVALNTVFNFATTTLRGVGKSVFEAILQGVGAVAFVVAGAIALANGAGVVPVLAILAGKEFLSATVALVALREDIGRPTRSPPGLWQRLVRVGLQLAVASAALALVTRIPTFVLASIGTTSDLAWYSAAQRLADALVLLAITSGFAVLPSLTFLFQTEPARAWVFLRRLLAAAAAAGILMGAVGAVFAHEIVTIAYGSDFEQAAAPTRVLMAGAPAYALLGIGWYALVALGRERALLVISVASALVSLALSVILIPDGGDVGAGISVAGAVWVMAGAMVAVLIAARRS